MPMMTMPLTGIGGDLNASGVTWPIMSAWVGAPYGDRPGGRVRRA